MFRPRPQRRVSAFRRFVASGRGAVTVDWVVLTAGICMLGALAANPVTNGMEALVQASANAVGRNPSAFGNILTIGIIGMALAEAIAIYALIIALR